MKPINIQYDGQVEVSSYGTFNMGGYALRDVLNNALHMNEHEFRTMNAHVQILIEVKPNTPLITGGEDEC